MSGGMGEERQLFEEQHILFLGKEDRPVRRPDRHRTKVDSARHRLTSAISAVPHDLVTSGGEDARRERPDLFTEQVEDPDVDIGG